MIVPVIVCLLDVAVLSTVNGPLATLACHGAPHLQAAVC